MNVRLHIERLVIDGLDVPFGARGLLGGALERELAQLIARGGLSRVLAAGGALPSLGTPQIEASAAPAQLGQAVARAVYGGLGAGRSKP